MGERILKAPSPYPLPRSGEGERAKFFKDTPRFCSLQQGERRDERVSPHPTLSRGVERGEKGREGIKKEFT